jgi:hypothetical protein
LFNLWGAKPPGGGDAAAARADKVALAATRDLAEGIPETSKADEKPSGGAAVSRRRGGIPERASVGACGDARLSGGYSDDAGV